MSKVNDFSKVCMMIITMVSTEQTQIIYEASQSLMVNVLPF